ncbi:MAG: MBL fold metallo-hydrolase [Kiritimatiellaeota bacterium]|nr:MBL fold metallo-hydrolase [Kiritimatiellota bacterium]
MNVSFQSFGGAREVTGSKHLLRVDGRNVLLDCGMFQGRRAEAFEKNRRLPFAPAELDCVVLSHGHLDHCGNLPSLPLDGYDGNVYATPASRDIANLILMDTAHIMAKDYEWLSRHEPGKKAYRPIYTERDVVRVLDHFITVNYRRPFPLCSGVACEFRNSGHILGSAVATVTFRDGSRERRVAFTGDLGRPGMPIIPDPEPLPEADYLICESTYGNRRHDPLEHARRQLAEVIRDTVDKGGKVIIPSFAVGRTQELVYFLHLLKDEKKIPDLDVFVDSPMAVNATGIFKVHQECYNETVRQAFLDHHKDPFGFNKLHYITDVEDSKKLNDRLDPCIIISSSGMCEAGRILHHLKNNIADSRNTILIVGFMAAHTLGRAIADRKSTVKIFGTPYPLRARVKILNTFSAHADFEDIRSYVAAMNLDRLRRVFLVHGEPAALEHLAQVLLEVGVRAVTIVEPAETYELDLA